MNTKYKQNIWQATHCSLNFFGLFIAFNTAQNIQSEALEDDGFGKLGFWSIGILYLSIMVGCFFSTAVQNKIGDVKCMALGSLLNTPWILSFALCGYKKENPNNDAFYLREDFITILIVVLSIINGLGQAIQWVGQGKYMSDCATEETKGFFFSYFWLFYMASQIFGNLIAAFCLNSMSQSSMFVILGLISFVSSISSLFLRKPNINVSRNDLNSSQQIARRNSQIFKIAEDNANEAQDVAILGGTRNTVGNMQGQGSQLDIPKKPTLKEEIISLCVMLFSARMRRLVPQLFWTGISIAFYSSALTPMITETIQDSGKKLERSMIAMVIFGIGQVAGSLLVGQIIDRRGSKYVSMLNCGIIFIMTFCTLAFLGINKFNMLAFLMTFIWGVQDAFVNINCLQILGFEFDNNSEPFSIFNMAQALGVFIFQIIESVIDSRIKYMIYTGFIGLIGLYSCGLTYFFDFREHNSQPLEVRISKINISLQSKEQNFDEHRV
ncbi:major facilitator superfamily protein [Stylonychia lemnae]|uniref:Major facilitator superfamily protein n=1 Tax=Stylonychia lemnae TaxID=5949 RepID=A0A078APN5_STYLE|nr:major facilitator superfamily protein [Stylonychia lemnae]|eukprot:CDW84340.1 major facilitator superfamily protein [Stylonychia lemnae]